MPLVKRLIEPLEISRKKVGLEVKNELECVSNNTLSCVIQQLSSLSSQSEDLFAELFSEACTVVVRSNNLSARIEGLKQKICLLNPTAEEVLLQEINQCKPFKSSSCRDQNLISKATRPFSINETYKLCEIPPALNKLDSYREDGKDSLKFYTNPGYFAELWVEEIKASQMMQKKHKHRSSGHHHHQSNRSTPQLNQRSVRTPKNRLEQYKALKHGAEFVENAKKENVDVLESNKGNYIGHNNNHNSNSINNNNNNNNNVSRSSVVNNNNNGNNSDGNKKTRVHNRNKKLNNSDINIKRTISPSIDGGSVNASSPVSHCEQQQQNQQQHLQQHLQNHQQQHQQDFIENKIEDNTKFNISINSKINIHDINTNNLVEQNNVVGHTTTMNEASRPQRQSNLTSNHMRPSAPPPAPPINTQTLKRAVNQEKSTNEITTHHLEQNLREEMMNKLSINSQHNTTQHQPQTTPYKYDLPPPPSPPASFQDSVHSDIIPPPPPLFPTPLPPDTLEFFSDLTSRHFDDGDDNDDEEVPPTTTSPSNQKPPSARDSRSDLLCAIREGIKLRKVEETRQKNEDKTCRKAGPGGLDVQSIMEAAFEMRRKVLEEENNEEEDEDDVEEESNWSD